MLPEYKRLYYTLSSYTLPILNHKTFDVQSCVTNILDNVEMLRYLSVKRTQCVRKV